MSSPSVSVVMIDSRSDRHPDWVQTAERSVRQQSLADVELVKVDNVGRKRTIGTCWNEGVRHAKADYVLFLGDDDWLSADYIATVLQYAMNNPQYTAWTTNMMAYKEDLLAPISRICTGMWRREYLLEHPFNETLERGVDREYLEEAVKRGERYLVISHHFGYYYRKHEDYSCAGDINFVQEPKDIYVLAQYPAFIDPVVSRIREKHDSIFVSTKQFDPKLAAEAKVIWCEWANANAVLASEFETDARKILRIHAYEAFAEPIRYVNFAAFDKIIFVAQHIRDYVERHAGFLKNAVVIPNGVDMSRFPSVWQKKKSNRIAYAGYISRKKGIGLLMFLAHSFPQYEFHVAGKYQEDDVAEYVETQKPRNLYVYPWQYGNELEAFFSDKSYILNTSVREGCPVAVLEGMAAGLMPVVNYWIGATSIFGRQYVFRSIRGFEAILQRGPEPQEHREYVGKYFNFDATYRQLEEIMLEGIHAEEKGFISEAAASG